MVNIGKKERIYHLDLKIEKLAIIGLIIAFSSAIVDTIWAVYLDGIFHNPSYVGFFSGFLTFISLLSFFFYIPIIERNEKDKLFTISLIVTVASLFIFSFIQNIWAIVFISIVWVLAANLRIASFGILVKDKSKDRDLVKNEGLIYTLFNTGWLIGPLAAGFLVVKYQFTGVFLISSLLVLMSLFLFKIFKIKDKNINKKVDGDLIKNLFDFFKDKNRTIAYFISGGINFWWVLVYLFMPLYLIESGKSISYISIFLFSVAVPTVAFGYFFAKVASKRGFKKMFITGYLILTLAALFSFIFPVIGVVTALVVIGSIGAAMIESTTEAYFLDILKKRDVYRFYSPYNTTTDINHLIAKFIPSIILLFFSYKFVFLTFAVAMFSFMILSFYTRNIIESKKKR